MVFLHIKYLFLYWWCEVCLDHITVFYVWIVAFENKDFLGNGLKVTGLFTLARPCNTGK